MYKLLTEVCKIQYGFPFDSSKFSDSTGVPVIRIRDVVRGYSETYTTETFDSEYIVNNGDMLVGMDGEFNIGKWSGGKALLNQRVCRLFPTEEVNADYLFRFMLKILKMIEDATPFATVKHLSAKQINKIVVPLLPMEQQNQIACIFNLLDSLIEHRKLQFNKLDKLVKSRFVELFGDLRINEKEWEIKTFSELAEFITDGEHSTPRRVEKGIYLLSARNVLNHSLQLNDVDYIDEDEYSRISKRIIPQKGDVLISCSGTVGKCCSVPENMKFQMVRSVAIVRFKNIINPIFAEHMITSDYLQEQINGSKTMSSQANLFQGKIAKLKGFVPPIELQESFVSFVEQTDKSKLAVQASLEKLEILKKALMQKYFG